MDIHFRHGSTCSSGHRRGIFGAGSCRCSSDPSDRRRRALMRLDRELSRRNCRNALAIAKQLQGMKPGCLTGFGSARQVPRRLSSAVDDLRLPGMDLSHLSPLVDSILGSIQSCIDFAQSEEEASISTGTSMLEVEEGDQPLDEEDIFMCTQHEAGHFLVGYLLGVLPKEYRVLKRGTPNQDQFAGGTVKFIGFEFLREVPDSNVLKKCISSGKLDYKANRRRLSSKAFNNFLCVTLGGLVAEHLHFGYSEGLHSDVNKLNQVIKWLGLAEPAAKSHIKWATVNTAFILHCHQQTRIQLAEAMASGKSIGSCLGAIEDCLQEKLV